MPQNPKVVITKKNDIIHEVRPKTLDIKIQYLIRPGRNFLTNDNGRTQPKNTTINIAEITLNIGSNSPAAFVTPQMKTNKIKINPATKKRNTASPFSPPYTFIIYTLIYDP